MELFLTTLLLAVVALYCAAMVLSAATERQKMRQLVAIKAPTAAHRQKRTTISQ
jgi:hypothetical protein